ncbi:hypothetical protein A4X13_0g9653 [Tilletia indica]|uniref:Uncharacterized protein n=1 Tax=Tilletia indica TaxID=43049 RepID=A0A8T8S8C5_9BASI|nr:hypothetical protein A4X13_0g9653 [Tilletia indica]
MFTVGLQIHGAQPRRGRAPQGLIVKGSARQAGGIEIQSQRIVAELRQCFDEALLAGQGIVEQTILSLEAHNPLSQGAGLDVVWPLIRLGAFDIRAPLLVTNIQQRLQLVFLQLLQWQQRLATSHATQQQVHLIIQRRAPGSGIDQG